MDRFPAAPEPPHLDATAPTGPLADTDSDDLSTLGYEQKLRRSIGGFTSFALAFSMVSINTGIVTLFNDPFDRAGGVAILLWLVVIPMVFTVVLVYAHLAGRIPLTGYAYQWSSRLVGPHFGWFTGWIALVSFIAGTAATAAAVGSVFAPEIWDDPSRGQVQALSIGVTLVVCLLNVFGVRIAGIVNNVGASIELVGTVLLALVLAVGAFFAFRHTQGPAILTDTTPVDGSPITLTSVALAALLPVYVLLGWEGAADLAEETTDPRRTTPPAMIRAVAVSGAMGLIVFALLAIDLPAVPATFLSGPGNPVLHLVGAQVGEVARAVMTVVAFASLFACLIANMAVATRMVFALGRDKMLPGSTALASVGRRTGAPVTAILVITALAIALNLLNAGLVEKIFAMVGLTYYLTYALTLTATAVAHRKGRIPSAPEGVFSLGRWLWPTLVVGLVWCATVIVVLTVPDENNQTALTVVVGVGLGFVWWLLGLRRRINTGQAGPPAAAVSSTSDRHGASGV
ncbi:amino acid permease [Streptomyces violaceusniger]|uniref:Amino acid permease n=2 Tax=Streptomyces violaceusniger group TaxID=2839105 RepID=A0ABD5JKL3_9ACTN|nr:amino acid permease [Streptomyces violaceusniger]KUL44655.1 amino acid permease [Streptomyces violaceusniger]MEE4588986.1 amino acid permease [Streptomyces sp. DSM 41602]